MRVRLFYNLIIISFLATISSCNDYVRDGIIGDWSIDTFYNKGFDIKNCLYVNTISFHSDNSCELPYSGNRCFELLKNNYGKKGTWELFRVQSQQGPLFYKVDILTNNEMFAGAHQITFYRDEANKLLKMEIYSDSFYLVCHKWLFDFDRNIDLIKKLESAR